MIIPLRGKRKRGGKKEEKKSNPLLPLKRGKVSKTNGLPKREKERGRPIHLYRGRGKIGFRNRKKNHIQRRAIGRVGKKKKKNHFSPSEEGGEKKKQLESRRMARKGTRGHRFRGEKRRGEKNWISNGEGREKRKECRQKITDDLTEGGALSPPLRKKKGKGGEATG